MTNEDRDLSLRFNLTSDARIKPFTEGTGGIMISFNSGRWITIKDTEEARECFERCEYVLKSEKSLSLYIELEDIQYDSTGRVHMIKHNVLHGGWDFDEALETFHDPGPSDPLDETA